MARIKEPTESELKSWQKWCDSRPPVVKALAERFPPWELFRIKSTGQRVFAISYFEGGTLKVAVTGRFNLVMMETAVFGIKPEDLEPCDLPQPGEPVGAMLTEMEDVEKYKDEMRLKVRPDLWMRDAGGKVVKRAH